MLRAAHPANKLELEIYDYDFGDEDDLLGGLAIPLSALEPGLEQEFWWKLQPPHKMHIKFTQPVRDEKERQW